MNIQPHKIESDVFFATHSIFTTEEYASFLAMRSGKPAVNAESRQTLLRHHIRQQRLLRIHRGLYASIPAGQNPATYSIDPYLVAAHLAKDSTLAYHTALSLHGIAQSIRQERVSLSIETTPGSFSYQGIWYRVISPPTMLPADIALKLGVETIDRQGSHIRVTTIERTLVDVCDRLTLSGGWEEVWRSLEGLDLHLDFDLILHYIKLLANATTAAKVGFFLETNRDRLRVPTPVLETLRHLAPNQPHYVERQRRTNAQLIATWNLMIPKHLEITPIPQEDIAEAIPL